MSFSMAVRAHRPGVVFVDGVRSFVVEWESDGIAVVRGYEDGRVGALNRVNSLWFASDKEQILNSELFNDGAFCRDLDKMRAFFSKALTDF